MTMRRCGDCLTVYVQKIHQAYQKILRSAVLMLTVWSAKNRWVGDEVYLFIKMVKSLMINNPEFLIKQDFKTIR